VRSAAPPLLLLAATALLPGRAWAQAPPSEGAVVDIEQFSLEDLLNPTVSTATKSRRTLEQSPSIVTVFRREDIDRLQARQLIDLLQHVPGFYEVSSQLERNVAIRGIHASAPYHFVVLLDGLPMNDFLFSSSSPDNFSLELAERVEIIRGPGSAIYGANALMGVVNVITRKADRGDNLRASLGLGTDRALRLEASGGHVTDSGSAFVALSLWRQDGTPFAADPGQDVLTPSLSQDISDGIQAGENLTAPLAGGRPRVNAYGPSFNVFLKYERGDNAALRLFLSRSQLNLQRTYRQALFSPLPGTQTPLYINERLVLDFEKRWGTTSGRGRLTFRPAILAFGHDMRSQSVLPPFYEAATRENTPLIYGWSGRDVRLSPSLEYAIDLPDFGPVRQIGLVAGLQAEYNVATDYRMNQCFVDGDRQFIPSTGVGDDRAGLADLFCVQGLMLREGTTVDPFGVVSQSGGPRFGDGDELRIGSFYQLTTVLPGDVGVVLGGRLDYTTTYSLQLSPRVAVVAPIGVGFYSKAQYSSAFVYPAFLYRTGNSLSDYQGNPDVQPQSIRTVEALLGWKGETIRTELSGYYNDVSRFITFDLARNARSGQFLFSNQGDLKIVGLEATALLRFLDNRLLVDLQGTYARPLAGTSERFVVDGALGGPTKYPELLSRAGLSFAPLDRLRLGINGSYSSRVQQTIAREVQFTQIPGTDGQPHSSQPAASFDTRDLTLDASVAYSPAARLQLELSGSNLLGRRSYRPGSVLVPYLSEGRRLQLRLSYDF
jgi:outer membrane receptor protein involved in Fe transport